MSGFPMRREIFYPLITPLKDKNAFLGNPDIFCLCLIKVSCIFKIHILSFMTLTLFARILGDSVYLSKYAQKGEESKKIQCVFLTY